MTLCTVQLAEFCTKWQTSVRRVLNLPLQTHCYLLPLLCRCLPVFDEVCGRAMNFVRSCLHHECSIVSSVAWYSRLYCTAVILLYSPVGRNVGLSLCLRSYNCTFDDLLSCHSFFSYHQSLCFCQLYKWSVHCSEFFYLNAFWYERALLIFLPVCFLHSDISE